MKEILNDVNNWLKTDKQIALATVIQTWGSAPRKAGAKMAMTADNQISGSVSGGCIEGAVYEAAMQTLETGAPQLLHFGVADETAWEVGLACGGNIDVWVEPLDIEAYHQIRQLIETEQAGESITIIAGDGLGNKLTLSRKGESLGTLGNASLDQQAATVAQTYHVPTRHQLTESTTVFVDTVRPAPHLIMVGGVHIAVALTHMAKVLGYRTTVIDPRRAFGSADRFPHVDQLIQQWPQKAFEQVVLDGETAVALLTHDPKIDDPALEAILETDVFYIGALGSRRTHAKRVKRLQEKGYSQATIDKIHGPIGLDIRAHTPEEIALSVLAEIVKTYRLPQ